jgi:hypothetical protein
MTVLTLAQFEEAKDFMTDRSKRDTAADVLQSLQHIYETLQEDQRKALTPITVFVDSMMPVQKRMADILPKRAVCDRLLEGYIGTSQDFYHIIHTPTFRSEYEAFWDGKGCSDGFLPRLLCVMCIGSRFDGAEHKGLSQDRSEGVHIPTACALVRNWLDNLRGKQLVDISTLEAEVLLLHAQRMLAARPQNTWTQLGIVSRLAMTMGLHRDPSEFPALSPFAGEMRRKLWFSILDMDLHAALAANLPGAVRDGEYTCRPPRNLDDAELHPGMAALPPGHPVDRRTNAQMQAYAAGTLPFRMRVTELLARIDTIRDYAEVLDIGSKLERILDDVNYLFPRGQALGSQARWREWRMRALLDMHVRRPLLALYRPFALSAPDCPRHITAMYLKSSMAMLTYMEELDPDQPGFKDVCHMYHVILKHDILQAAFSVCFFIKRAVAAEQEGGGGTSPRGWAASPSPSDPGENRMIWSRAGMTAAVEKTLGNLSGLVKDASTDLKDVMALAIVLAAVQPAASPAERVERINRQLNKVLDGCVESLRGSGAAIRFDLPLAAKRAKADSAGEWLDFLLVS